MFVLLNKHGFVVPGSRCERFEDAKLAAEKPQGKIRGGLYRRKTRMGLDNEDLG